MNIKEAYRLCPQGIYMHPNFEKYTAASNQLHKIWADYTDVIEYLSLDEGYLDLTGRYKAQVDVARKIAREIKARTKSEVGLTCSVGIGYSMTSAKLASEEKKPDGYFEILTPEDFVALIIDRKVEVLYGVGSKTAEKLQHQGIKTVRDIRNNREKVISLFGKVGHYIADLSFGIDDRQVTPYDEAEAKSIAREVTFQRNTDNFSFLKDVLMVLAVALELRLKRLGLYARTVTLKITFPNMKSITRSRSSEATNEAYEIFMAVFGLLKSVNRSDKSGFIRLIGISLQNLSTSGARQLTFREFNDFSEKSLKERWDKALRGLEQKYGIQLNDWERRERLYEIIGTMQHATISKKSGEEYG